MSTGERRLAAIMFTDMVGYTVLSQRDEALAMRLLFEQGRLLRSIFPKHGGREVKSIGDSFLVEFPSALDAVDCAIAVQQELHERNATVTSERRLEIRIGIHVGDVIHSNGDIFGDAVNICSRIQSAAISGGICISEQVHDNVQNKIALPLVKMEKRWLKNVELPVEVYRVVMPWGEEKGTSYTMFNKYRIAVLPFKNLSPDPNDEYFADGMTEELITVLSHVKDLSVIARTSVMQYKNASKKISDIARELSVGTLIEGSVRKAANKVRLTVQLVDPQSEGHIWARSYDKQIGDIFAIQTEIAKRITRALKVQLLSAEARQIVKRVAKSDAYIAFLKGMHFRNQVNEEGWRKAIGFFEKAIEIDSDYPEAIAAMSICYDWLAYFAFEPPDKAYARAKELAVDALKRDEGMAEGHLSLYYVLFYHEADWRAAETELKRALELNPSSAEAHNGYAFHLANFDRTEEAVHEAEKALELDPLSVMSHVIYADVLAWVGRYDQAIVKYNEALEVDPKLPIAHNDLGTAYIAMGKLEEGVRELEKASALSGSSPFFESNLGYAYAISGRRDEARRIANGLKDAYSKGLLPAYFLAGVYAGLGETEEALAWLEKAYAQNAIIFTPLLNVEPTLTNLRGEPRFKDLLRKLKLEQGETS